MKFSTKAEYGLRAMIRLARNKAKEPYSLAQIAREEHISLAYLERLISRLKRAGLVLSTKGVAGGYKLSRAPEKISIGEVFVALEGSLAPYKCVGVGVFCSARGCATKVVWQKLQKAVEKTLNSIKLKDLI